MNKNKKTTSEKAFDITSELVFWNSFKDPKNAEAQLVERFKKIRNEKIGKEEAQVISKNMERIIPDKKKPLFFLKIFLELPKKECAITKELNKTIKNYCKAVFEQQGIDESCITGKEICLSNNPEKIISNFIDALQKHLKTPLYAKEDILAIAYIWLVMICKEHRLYKYWETIIAIEKVFVFRFRKEDEKHLKDCVFKSIPKAIINKTYEKQFLNISYLYTDYEVTLKEALEKKSSLEDAVQNLLSENKSYCEEITTLKDKISDLEKMLKNIQTEYATVKEDLVLTDNMLKFEKNKFEQQYINKEKNLMSEVESVIGLEIEGIEGIAGRLPEKEKERLLRYVRRIKERITELGGQNNA